MNKQVCVDNDHEPYLWPHFQPFVKLFRCFECARRESWGRAFEGVQKLLIANSF